MRALLKAAFLCLILVVVAVPAILFLGADHLAAAASVRFFEDLTGFGVEVRSVDVRLGGGSVVFDEVRLINPDPFPPDEAIRVARLYAEPTWDTLLGREICFHVLELDVSQVVLIRPAEGISNLELLAENAQAWSDGRSDSDQASLIESTTQMVGAIGLHTPLMTVDAAMVEDAAGTEIRIDRLVLRLGSLRVIDHKLGRYEPVTFTYEVNHDEVYEDVTDLDALLKDLAVDLAVDALVAGLAGVGDQGDDQTGGIGDFLRRALKKGDAPPPVDDPADLFRDVLP